MAKAKKTNRLRSFSLVLGAMVILGGIAFAGATFGKKPVVAAETPNGETKNVIVQFKNAQAVTGAANAELRQSAIESANAKVFDAIPYSTGFKQKTQEFDNLPYAVYTVDAEGEASLKADPNVASVKQDNMYAPALQQAVATVGGSTSTGFTDTSGTYTGNGTAVAILDSGVLANHTMLSGKVIAEACFGVTGTGSGFTVASNCPGGAATSTATGSGAPCTTSDSCAHGTHVASIAAGKTFSTTFESNPYTLGGVAKNADVIAMQVFSTVTSSTVCSVQEGNPCIRTFDSSVAAALNHLINLQINNTLGKPIVAANMSLGSGAYDNETTCSDDSTIYAQAITSLFNVGIAPVIANGNNGANAGVENKIGSPACMPNAIAVGATNKAGNAIAYYSQNGALTDILAPGGDYDGNNNSLILAASNASTTAVAPNQGTSMAAPMVAGAFAVVKEKHPKATVTEVLSLLQSSGVNVTENRSGYTPVVKKRINVANALSQSPYATISSFTGPSGAINEGQAITLNATVANASSCSLNNNVGAVTINNGSISVSVPGAASYTLTCLNAYRDATADTVNFTTNAAPSVPTITQQAFDEAAGKFTLTWSASTDTNGIQEYRVFLNGQQVATLPAGTTTYTFENLIGGTAYTAEVRAVDTLGAISSAASATFGSTPAGGTAPGTPNTGAQNLIDGLGAKGFAVAVLGIIAAVAILVTVMKRRTR